MKYYVELEDGDKYAVVFFADGTRRYAAKNRSLAEAAKIAGALNENQVPNL